MHVAQVALSANFGRACKLVERHGGCSQCGTTPQEVSDGREFRTLFVIGEVGV
jgi:hypothetical protein